MTMTRETFTIGSQATITHTVTPENSASAWGNKLDVLATPVLLWLSEIAAMKAIEQQLPSEYMTVGAAHDSIHKAPTPTGDTITVTAELVEIASRTLAFDVKAYDSRTVILEGRHTRAVVNAEAFSTRVFELASQVGH